jgi:hypothetical protein
MTEDPIRSAQEIPQNELEKLGFNRIGKTSFYTLSYEHTFGKDDINNPHLDGRTMVTNITIGFNQETGEYSFWKNVLDEETLKKVVGLKVPDEDISSFSYLRTPGEFEVKVNDNVPFYTGVIGLNDLFPNESPRLRVTTLDQYGIDVLSDYTNAVETINNTPIDMYLLGAGFAQDKDNPEIYRLFGKNGNNQEISLIAFVENTGNGKRLFRLLTPFNPNVVAKYQLNRATVDAVHTTLGDYGNSPTIELDIRTDEIQLVLSSDRTRQVRDIIPLVPVTEEMLGISSYESHPDISSPKFIVGGVNSTETIRSLTTLAGKPIQDLEFIMRPGRWSGDGFLGEDEPLIEVLALDNDTVLSHGLTHQELAAPLEFFLELAESELPNTLEVYGRKYKVIRQGWASGQASPFGDGLSNVDITIIDVEANVMLTYSGLLVPMIKKWGFYEGEGTNYRVSPKQIVEFFPHLQELSRNRLSSPQIEN